MNPNWWENGIRFECQQSGNCCVSHGEYGFVYLTKNDRQNMAKEIGLSTIQFTKKYCQKTDGFFHLKDNGDACIFLKKHKCTVYKSRPMQCRTWPFWPETMKNAKTWKKDVSHFCPGVGKGALRKPQEIASQLEQQKKWEEQLAKQAT